MIPVLPHLNIDFRAISLPYVLRTTAILLVVFTWLVGHLGGYVHDIGGPACFYAGEAQ